MGQQQPAGEHYREQQQFQSVQLRFRQAPLLPDSDDQWCQ